MTEDKGSKDSNEDKTLETARASLDQSVDEMPDDISSALAAARQRAMQRATSADSTSPEIDRSNVVEGHFSSKRNRMVWGGAMAASCAALTLSLVLQQSGTDASLPLNLEGSLAFDEEDSMLILAEMDETEWGLVQELEFALWLSEFGDEAAAADFSG